MNSERLDQLLSFLKETPDDPFVLYALALEYKSLNPELASQYFSHLLQTHADYLPAYYQAAQFQEETGNREEALRLYHLGIDLARKQNEVATLRELQAAYHLLLED